MLEQEKQQQLVQQSRLQGYHGVAPDFASCKLHACRDAI